MSRRSLSLEKGSATATCAPSPPREDAPHPGRAGAAPGRLEEGELIAARYRVSRFVAEGAMGSVYAVEDLSLGERVALKTIRSAEGSPSPPLLKRFRRELRLARRVTHPNVCRVFDLGEHAVSTGAPGSATIVPFFTMELLEGETLKAHLRRHGPLAPEQVFPLAEQMAAALEAAHSAQVIHRDFKSGNVMLVPTAQGSLRAVVTDFGLARGEGLENDDSSTQAGTLVGTPKYMSPEQVEGRALSPASDLYSLGVVLFEMVTGRVPFLGDTPMVVAVKRLFEPPPSPRVFAPELPPSWEAALLRALARRPEERFTSASELVEALRHALPAAGAPPARALLPPPPLEPLASLLPEPSSLSSESETGEARRVVAVLAPRNLSGQAASAWLSTALAEMLSAELAAGLRVRLLSAESTERMCRELSLLESESLAPDTLQRLLAHSGVELVLTGSYLVLGAEGGAGVRLDLRLQETRTGETTAHLTRTGMERDLLAIILGLGAALRERLGIVPPTSEETYRVRGAQPVHVEAARLYAQGLLALRDHDSPLAIARLERVVELEPGFAPGHSALAAACRHAFLEVRARSAARRAFELSGGLSREERLLVVARYHEARAEWAPAIEAYRTLLEFFPDNVEYGTALVSAQATAGLVRDALGTLEALQRLPGPVSEDARVALSAATATMFTGDFPASRRHAERAVVRARRAGQALIVSSALLTQAYAMRNLGELEQAMTALDEAVRLSLSRGDRGGAARAIIARCFVLIDLGRMRDAMGSFAAVLRVARELQNQALEAEVLGNAGWVSAHLGDLDAALRRSNRAKALYRKLEMRADEAFIDTQIGMVLRWRGDLDKAQRLLEQARQASTIVFGDEFMEGWASHELGLLFLDRGEREQGRQWLERALGLRQARGLRPFIAETELALARLALESGRAEEALPLAERACEAYVEQRQRALEGAAQTVRALALRAGGAVERAGEALARARALTADCEYVRITAEVALTRARLARGAESLTERQEAARGLHALIAQASQGRMMGVLLEGRLVRAELRLDPEEALAELRKVESETSRLGYRALAHRAGIALAPPPQSSVSPSKGVDSGAASMP